MNKVKTFRSRILFIVLTCFLIFAFLLSSVSIYYSYRQMKGEFRERLTNQLSVQAQMLDAELLKASAIGAVIHNYVMNTIDLERARQDAVYLEAYKKQCEPVIYSLAELYGAAWIFFNPELRSEGHDIWYLKNRDSGEILRMPEYGTSFYEDEAGKDWFFLAKREKGCLWTNPYPALAEGLEDVTWVTFSCAIYKEGIFVGVCGYDFYFSELEVSLEEISLFESGYATLLNEDYQFLIHPDLDQTTSLKDYREGRYHWMTEEMAKEKEGILEYLWDEGEPRIMAYSRLSNGWIIGMTADRRIIFQPLVDQIRFMVIIIGAGILAFYALMYNLTIRLTHGIERLTHAVEVTGRGDYDTPVTRGLLEDPTEIGVLARTLEEMRLLQKQSFEEIRLYNEELETMVGKRTLELEISLRNLKNTQQKLVESEKFEATSRLLMEISHRLNTPLGNCRMTLSYMDEQVIALLAAEFPPDRETLDQTLLSLRESSQIAASGIRSSIGIIQSLQELTRDFINKEPVVVHMAELIQFSIEKFRYDNHLDDKTKIHLDCPETLTLTTYPNRLMRILANLFLYSVRYSMVHRKEKSIWVSVKEEGDRILLEYEDHSELLYTELKERIFEPYSVSSFKRDAGGIEMHMIFSLVKIGLSGEIECYEGPQGRPCYLISLPVSPG